MPLSGLSGRFSHSTNNIAGSLSYSSSSKVGQLTGLQGHAEPVCVTPRSIRCKDPSEDSARHQAGYEAGDCDAHRSRADVGGR